MNRKTAPDTNLSVGPTPASMPTATTSPEPTFTITQSELRNMLSDLLSQGVATSPATVTASHDASTARQPRPATPAEDCTTYRLLSLLEQATSKAILGARDRVAVPTNLYVVDKAAPQGLAVIAAGSCAAASAARRISDCFARLANTAAAKSAALTRR